MSMKKKKGQVAEKIEARLLWPSFCYEVLKATTMLFYMLSGIETNRPRHLQKIPGGNFNLRLAGLPGLCLSPCIIGPSNDDLYGIAGTAARIAFKGWFLEVYGIWEYDYRQKLKNEHRVVGDFSPELDALGDMRLIRNDLLHNRGVATSGSKGKCKA